MLPSVSLFRILDIDISIDINQRGTIEMPSAISPQLRIAVIGTGPGGLSSAIALSELPNVDLRIYEKAGELKNLGAGISVNLNGWKVLELLGIRDRVNGASTNPTVQR